MHVCVFVLGVCIWHLDSCWQQLDLQTNKQKQNKTKHKHRERERERKRTKRGKKKNTKREIREKKEKEDKESKLKNYADIPTVVKSKSLSISLISIPFF